MQLPGIGPADVHLRTALRTNGRHVRPLGAALSWWAVLSFGLVSLVFAVVLTLWPLPVRMFASTLLGGWLLFTALGRFGAAYLLPIGPDQPPWPALGAAALCVVAGALLVRSTPADPTTAAAAASLTAGIAAAADAATAGRLPTNLRQWMRLRAACWLLAAAALASAPVHLLGPAAAAVGIADVALAVRLLPDVERTVQTLELAGATDSGSGRDRHPGRDLFSDLLDGGADRVHRLDPPSRQRIDQQRAAQGAVGDRAAGHREPR